ncbi:hypothetical protein RchiOBHm_Chr7g0181541 [Rosa chinensis]|uniref:Uncharacterized protein n=1 Tax=Rosa chinensis TaxID=74649 RepID=A0A2P6P2P2_ROSCH|nr:hypothetical protein RchiOBHm_Chr7g0181541 [Rosa chinensis]
MPLVSKQTRFHVLGHFESETASLSLSLSLSLDLDFDLVTAAFLSRRRRSLHHRRSLSLRRQQPSVVVPRHLLHPRRLPSPH